MNNPMFFQIESQPKRHQIFIDGQEVFSSDVLLEALEKYNQACQQHSDQNVEFKSVCTYEGKNHE